MTYQRNFDRRVRVGVVGVGDHAYRNILAVLTFLPVELVAVADVNEELGALTAKQYGARSYGTAAEMYAAEELDAVLLCVGAKLHPILATEAFEAGLDVWMEKPAASTVAEVDGMIAARGDRVCVVGYKKVFAPATSKTLELIASGALGAPRTILAEYPLTIPHGGRELASQPSGWLANGCHPVSFLLAVGGEGESVTVHRASDDAGVLVLRHRTGTLSTLHLSFGAPYAQPFERYSVFGDNASVEIDNNRRVVFQRGMPFDYSQMSNFSPEGLDSGAIVWEPQDSLNTLENKSEFTQGLHSELMYFLECVLDRRQPQLATLEFARQVAAVHEAAIISNDTTINLETLS
jgi:predicted dehydrogenase